jgi:hypothetical protein
MEAWDSDGRLEDGDPQPTAAIDRPASKRAILPGAIIPSGVCCGCER